MWKNSVRDAPFGPKMTAKRVFLRMVAWVGGMTFAILVTLYVLEFFVLNNARVRISNHSGQTIEQGVWSVAVAGSSRFTHHDIGRIAPGESKAFDFKVPGSRRYLVRVRLESGAELEDRDDYVSDPLNLLKTAEERREVVEVIVGPDNIELRVP